MDVVVSFLSSFLTVPNIDSGILSVVPIALFISDAVRATGSLLLSFASGDTACLLGPSHSDAAGVALAEGVDEGASGLSANYSVT